MTELKKGYITPSSFSKIMAVRGLGKVAQDYADEIVLDLLGVQRLSFTAPATNWGIEKEQEAIDRYSLLTLQTVQKVEGAIYHPEIDFVKGTPDGLILELNGMIEVKCPYNPINHLSNIRNCQPEIWEMPKGSYLEDYWHQVQGYLWITERDWCDFISYDPRFAPDEQIVIQRVYPNKKDIDALRERTAEFWTIVLDRIPSKYKTV
jgi:hypothetical protein